MSSPNKFIWFDDRKVLDTDIVESLIPAISISCAPTCDFACPHCIYNTPYQRRAVGMSVDEKLSLVKEAATLGCKFLQICHEGEPFLDPSTLPVLREAHQQGMRSLIFTHGAHITRDIANELYDMRVCLGVKCDSLDEQIFNKMIGVPLANKIYAGIENLLNTGYSTPFERDGNLFTGLSLICTVTELNVDTVKDVAKYCWDNNMFFNVARLERGGRANSIWEKISVKDAGKLREIIRWCSEQTGIDYRYAQPDCYCIGACGIQIKHNGDAWVTREGCSCDLTEPDGITFPDTRVIGNVRSDGLKEVIDRVWQYRSKIVDSLDKRLQDYIDNLGADANILAACGGSRTHYLFRAYKNYVQNTLAKSGVPVR